MASNPHLPRADRPSGRPTSQPLVSAVIPTRNRPQFVVNAVRSALGQSYPYIEVIVVIDGDDVTQDRLDPIDDPRLRVISLAANVGGSEARNTGIRAACGEWIALLDDDDEWLPDKIRLQLHAAVVMGVPEPVIASRVLGRGSSREFLWPRRLYRTGQPVSDYLYCREGVLDAANIIQTSTLLLRRELMIAVPFRKGLKMHQDSDWLLRASRRPGVAIAMLPEALTIYRLDESGASVGRTIDWEFSTAWAREMRAYFSPQAYSWFVGSECAWRALRSRAGRKAYARIVHEFFRGRPTFRSTLTLAISAVLQGVVSARFPELARIFRAARPRLATFVFARARNFQQKTSMGVRQWKQLNIQRHF